MANEVIQAAITRAMTESSQAVTPEIGRQLRGRTPLRILVDACLTPGSVQHLAQVFGSAVDVRHADQVLPPATTDMAVLNWAAAEQRLVVTANGADFLRLVRSVTSHPGLGLVTDQNTRLRQLTSIESLVSGVLSHFTKGGTIADHVFTVRKTAGRLVVRRFP